MAFYNPQYVDFNYNTGVIENVGAFGGALQRGMQNIRQNRQNDELMKLKQDANAFHQQNENRNFEFQKARQDEAVRQFNLNLAQNQREADALNAYRNKQLGLDWARLNQQQRANDMANQMALLKMQEARDLANAQNEADEANFQRDLNELFNANQSTKTFFNELDKLRQRSPDSRNIWGMGDQAVGFAKSFFNKDGMSDAELAERIKNEQKAMMAKALFGGNPSDKDMARLDEMMDFASMFNPKAGDKNSAIMSMLVQKRTDLALNETNEKYAKMAGQRYVINNPALQEMLRNAYEKEVGEIKSRSDEMLRYFGGEVAKPKLTSLDDNGNAMPLNTPQSVINPLDEAVKGFSNFGLNTATANGNIYIDVGGSAIEISPEDLARYGGVEGVLRQIKGQ